MLDGKPAEIAFNINDSGNMDDFDSIKEFIEFNGEGFAFGEFESGGHGFSFFVVVASMFVVYPRGAGCQGKSTGYPGEIVMSGNKEPSKITIDIGLRIKDARKKKFGKSYIFARVMQVSPTTVSGWEAGKAAFTAEHLYELAKMLDVSPGWLLTGDD